MSFKKNKYCVIKNAVSKELCDFLSEYILVKRKLARIVYNRGLVVPGFDLFGGFGDGQIQNSYNHYGDIAMDCLLSKIKPLMEKQTKLKLTPTYSYMRIYKKGDELKKHVDRKSCEISTTLNLSGDRWPIFIENKSVDLSVGDMLIYRGCELQHWREPFTGEICVQVFLHYNETNGKFENKFDGRDFLGLPTKKLNEASN
jgi:hypothetical protein